MLKPTKFTDKEKMLKLYFVMEYVGGGESFNKVAKGRLKEREIQTYSYWDLKKSESMQWSLFAKLIVRFSDDLEEMDCIA